MSTLNRLYQRLMGMDYTTMYEIEADFFVELHHDFPENPMPWITAFLPFQAGSGHLRGAEYGPFMKPGIIGTWKSLSGI